MRFTSPWWLALGVLVVGALAAGALVLSRRRALADLPKAITVTREDVDLAAWFAGGGGLLVALALALSLWWNRVRRSP